MTGSKQLPMSVESADSPTVCMDGIETSVQLVLLTSDLANGTVGLKSF